MPPVSTLGHGDASKRRSPPTFGALGRSVRAQLRLILGIAGVLMILIPWELVSRLGLTRSVLLSSPTAVTEALINDVVTGRIWPHAWASFQVWALGFGLATIAGILLGLIAGWYRRVGLVAIPWLQVVYVAPDLAFVPLFILWFGLGLVFKVWVVFVGVLIYVALNTIAGVQATEDRFLAVARTYGASRLMVFRTIVLPGSVPYIMTGLRLASGRALVGVVGAEFISSNEGLGFVISISGALLQTDRLFAGLIILASFGIVLNELLGRLERRFERWRAEAHP